MPEGYWLRIKWGGWTTQPFRCFQKYPKIEVPPNQEFMRVFHYKPPNHFKNMSQESQVYWVYCSGARHLKPLFFQSCEIMEDMLILLLQLLPPPPLLLHVFVSKCQSQKTRTRGIFLGHPAPWERLQLNHQRPPLPWLSSRWITAVASFLKQKAGISIPRSRYGKNEPKTHGVWIPMIYSNPNEYCMSRPVLSTKHLTIIRKQIIQ